jgi:hypothetical protein
MATSPNINPDDIQPDIANDLVKGIVARLHAVFGDGYTYYAEDVPQGFKTPSFAVVSMMPLKSTGLDNRKYWEFPFDVHYFCDSRKPRQEWNRGGTTLGSEMEWLKACNTTLRGEIQPSSYDSEQAVGHFYIMYGMHLLSVYAESPKMEVLAKKSVKTNGDGVSSEDGKVQFVAGDKGILGGICNE